jgi:hypothetical protein
MIARTSVLAISINIFELRAYICSPDFSGGSRRRWQFQDMHSAAHALILGMSHGRRGGRFFGPPIISPRRCRCIRRATLVRFLLWKDDFALAAPYNCRLRFLVMDDQNRFFPPIELLIVIAINLAVVALGYYAFRLWGLFLS